MQQHIDTYDFKGKKAIVRVDFNVPLDENFNITDDTRIRAALPTLKKVLAEGGSLILMSHLDVLRELILSSPSSIFSLTSLSVSAFRFSSPTTARRLTSRPPRSSQVRS